IHGSLKHYWFLVPLSLDESVLQEKRNEPLLRAQCQAVSTFQSAEPIDFIRQNALYLSDLVAELSPVLSSWPPTPRLPSDLEGAIGTRPKVKAWLFPTAENWRWLREGVESLSEHFFFSTHITRGVWENSEDKRKSELAWDAHVQVVCFTKADLASL